MCLFRFLPLLRKKTLLTKNPLNSDVENLTHLNNRCKKKKALSLQPHALPFAGPFHSIAHVGFGFAVNVFLAGKGEGLELYFFGELKT